MTGNSDLEISLCTPADISAIVDILETQRTRLAELEPVFWKRAAHAREETGPFMEQMAADGNRLFLVARQPDGLKGFLLASPMPTPPVYDAGPTAGIDDFYVCRPELWPSAGQALLTEARKRLKANGFNQIVVVSPYGDAAKMQFLRAQDLSLASAWFTAAL